MNNSDATLHIPFSFSKLEHMYFGYCKQVSNCNPRCLKCELSDFYIDQTMGTPFEPYIIKTTSLYRVLFGGDIVTTFVLQASYSSIINIIDIIVFNSIENSEVKEGFTKFKYDVLQTLNKNTDFMTFIGMLEHIILYGLALLHKCTGLLVNMKPIY